MEKEGNNLFQVNLKGMIALLSEHIYSNPNTFVRELLQNCVDAITALRNIDENYKGRIDVFLNEDKTVVFRDNGIGLKEEEVYRFLTVIGESSKRDTPDADDFIGRFGIGLLSCFVVTNEITVESRSACLLVWKSGWDVSADFIRRRTAYRLTGSIAPERRLDASF